MTPNLTGLDKNKVELLKLAGKTNAFAIDSGKSTWQIIKDNTFNLFIVLNVLMALALLAVGSYMNTLFIFFVGIGVASGIIVEIRARNLVRKLTLLNKGQVTAIRDGEEIRVDPDDLVLGDLLKLSVGDQVPADSLILSGHCEVNESLLTGESDLLEKNRGKNLLSGSIIASGLVYTSVEHVGADNYITKLAIEAKTHKPIQSEILGSIKTVTKFTSRVILPLGAILLLEALLVKNDTLQGSVVSTSAALLGMLPKGLAVLTIIALITAVFKLGRRKVLVQEIYSVETMAHVDTLCLDKTGTLTEGKMKVKALELLSKRHSESKTKDILGSFLKNSIDRNSTIEALRNYFTENEKYSAKNSVNFSSERKWSAVYLEGIGMVVLGAPERIFENVPATVLERQKKGLRVLGLGLSDKKEITSKHILTGVEPLAIIELEDSVRKDAKKTLKYLRDQGVDLKVISGDNPATVSKIAERAGFINFEKYLDASALDDEELKESVKTTAIFGRVSPRQKKLIIAELKAAGHTVAMTGDGVNDILALREADLSIVMAEGDAATRQISNIVLLSSNFSEVPKILFEGRRVVNNMSRVASIFFIKTIYSLFLSVLCAASIATGQIVVFPFISLQITIIDQLLEGWPSFFMSFEEDKKKATKNFLRAALKKALPQALMVTAGLTIVHFWATAHDWGALETTTLMYYLLGAVMLIGVFKASQPFSKLRVFLFATAALGFFGSALILGKWFSGLTSLEVISPRALILLAILTVACVLARFIIDAHNKKRRRLV
jgi:cation-transporting ATPase E